MRNIPTYDLRPPMSHNVIYALTVALRRTWGPEVVAIMAGDGAAVDWLDTKMVRALVRMWRRRGPVPGTDDATAAGHAFMRDQLGRISQWWKVRFEQRGGGKKPGIKVDVMSVDRAYVALRVVLR
jgi:hypothetical protein